MREFGFELRVCARLEASGELVARQLGGGVTRPGNRVLDVVRLEPGGAFEDRAAITPAAIPAAAIDADVGVGRFRYWKDVVRNLPVPIERAREVVDRAVEIGFFERERRRGREVIRQTARYPSGWYDAIRAIENKPDLSSPGDLADQVRHDVSLGLVDEVVVATRSHVTGAHLNRLPDAVGVWEVRDDGIEVVREATRLRVESPGVEVLDPRPGRVDIDIADAQAKAAARRTLAERAYGKGWRTYDFPDCGCVDARSIAGAAGLPWCGWKDRVVNPGVECGPQCPGFDPALGPGIDRAAIRDRGSPWKAIPSTGPRRQAGLDRF